MSQPVTSIPEETSALLTSTNPSQPAPTYTNPKRANTIQTPIRTLPKVDTNLSWSTPAGLAPRGQNDESLIIFRRALGINSDRATSTDGGSLEEGRKKAVGIYGTVLREQKSKRLAHHTLSIILYMCYFSQIVIGAVLTALGPNARDYELPITILGAANTILAGILALLKGQGLPEGWRKDEVNFRKLQDWIEETEALLAVGIVGRNRKEVGVLVEVAFKKYNACFGQSYEVLGLGNDSDSDGDVPSKKRGR